jgi:hypothetical protein
MEPAEIEPEDLPLAMAARVPISVVRDAQGDHQAPGLRRPTHTLSTTLPSLPPSAKRS